MLERWALGAIVLCLAGLGLLSCGAPAAPAVLATVTPGPVQASAPEPWKLTATAETVGRSAAAVAQQAAAAVAAAATSTTLAADPAPSAVFNATAAGGPAAASGAAADPSDCGGAIAQVQRFRAANTTTPVDEHLSMALALVRDAGPRIDVDGWSVSGAPPQCWVGFRYRENGASITLRWQADVVTGQVRPTDDRTRRSSGF
jgi:hypothetical protein